MKLTKEQILSQGWVEIPVKVTGINQRHKFFVVKEKTPFGEVAYLVTKGNITAAELARIAEEYDFPVRSPLGTAFPPGKGSRDFAISENK